MIPISKEEIREWRHWKGRSQYSVSVTVWPGIVTVETWYTVLMAVFPGKVAKLYPSTKMRSRQWRHQEGDLQYLVTVVA